MSTTEYTSPPTSAMRHQRSRGFGTAHWTGMVRGGARAEGRYCRREGGRAASHEADRGRDRRGGDRSHRSPRRSRTRRARCHARSLLSQGEWKLGPAAVALRAGRRLCPFSGMLQCLAAPNTAPPASSSTWSCLPSRPPLKTYPEVDVAEVLNLCVPALTDELAREMRDARQQLIQEIRKRARLVKARRARSRQIKDCDYD
jgi:hypothetical protein